MFNYTKYFNYCFLQGEIDTTNTALQASCDNLLRKGEHLIMCRRVQKNIAAAIEQLSLCLPGRIYVVLTFKNLLNATIPCVAHYFGMWQSLRQRSLKILYCM